MDPIYSALWENKAVVLPVPVTIAIVDDSPTDAGVMEAILRARPKTSCEVLILKGSAKSEEEAVWPAADIYLVNFQAGMSRYLSQGERIARAVRGEGALVGSITPREVRTERACGEKIPQFRMKALLGEDFDALENFMRFISLLLLRYKGDVEAIRRPRL